MNELRCLKFTNNGFRLNYDWKTYTSTMSFEPIKDEKIEIDVLCGQKDLSPLIELLPNVKYLKISFCDSSKRYDVSIFKDMKHLEEIVFYKDIPGGSITRLLGTQSLVGKIPKITVYDKILTPEDPIYPWKKIRDPRFGHINRIKTLEKMTIWDVDCTDEVGKAIKLSEENQDTSNIIVQKIGDTFLVIYKYFEGNHAEDLQYKEITEEKFLRIIFNSKNYNFAEIKDVPYQQDNLFIEDNVD